MAESVIPPLPSETLSNARKLRQSMTDAEQALWYHLRAGRFGGFKFRRQHPVPPYVVDFVCLAQLLVVELDGSQHSPSVDAERNSFLDRAGFRLLRFWNHDVLTQTESVLTHIWSALHDRTLSPNPSPTGRGAHAKIPAMTQTADKATYLTGFANDFATEALPGALPIGRNSPQRCAYGLYAEQISGSAFTAPRHANRRSWMYRIRPAAIHGRFEPHAQPRFHNRFDEIAVSPEQYRWSPLPLPTEPTDFIDGLFSMGGSGGPDAGGMAVHLYAANRDMSDRFFYSADSELLIVPQLGRLCIDSELGRVEVEPQQIAVLPRGIRFSVSLPDGEARGYVCENFGALLKLPDLGVIGSNGLANPRDFETPVARYEQREGEFELIAKFQGQLWRAPIGHSPLDVVAWHGNYAPYRYDLRRFNTIGSISYDHPDPSIFLVLHSPGEVEGVSNLDFVIFPPRWLVAQNTFRPPWFHRNVASEFMGLVHGAYDAKAEGFVPGGASLHNCMTGHGPDAATFDKASKADLSKPDVITDTMAFMFEAPRVIRPTKHAVEAAHRQRDYPDCWAGLQANFDAAKP